MTSKTLDRQLSDAYKQAIRRLAEIEALCRRHNNPSVVTSTQILASKVIAIIEGEANAK